MISAQRLLNISQLDRNLFPGQKTAAKITEQILRFMSEEVQFHDGKTPDEQSKFSYVSCPELLETILCMSRIGILSPADTMIIWTIISYHTGYLNKIQLIHNTI